MVLIYYVQNILFPCSPFHFILLSLSFTSPTFSYHSCRMFITLGISSIHSESFLWSFFSKKIFRSVISFWIFGSMLQFSPQLFFRKLHVCLFFSCLFTLNEESALQYCVDFLWIPFSCTPQQNSLLRSARRQRNG